MLYEERTQKAVHAIQWTGKNLDEVLEFVRGASCFRFRLGNDSPDFCKKVEDWKHRLQFVTNGNYLTRARRDEVREVDRYVFERQYVALPEEAIK